mgnify:FL=1
MFPIRSSELEKEPFDPKGLKEDEIFQELVDIVPSYASDYIWGNKDEWITKDMPTLISVMEKMKETDRTTIDKYNRAILTMDSAARLLYRSANPEMDAALNFWGHVRTTRSERAKALIRKRADMLGIPYNIIPGLAVKPTKGKIPLPSGLFK